MDLNIRVLFFNKRLDESKDVIGLLIRHEAHADLGFGLWCNSCFHTRSGITAHDPVDFERGHNPDASHNIFGLLAPNLLQFVRGLELFHVEAGSQEAFDLDLCCLCNIVIKPWDAYLPRSCVVTLRDNLTEFTDRVPCRATSQSGMDILCARFQNKSHRSHSSQAICNGRLAARDPNSVRDDNGIGADPRLV